MHTKLLLNLPIIAIRFPLGKFPLTLWRISLRAENKNNKIRTQSRNLRGTCSLKSANYAWKNLAQLIFFATFYNLISWELIFQKLTRWHNQSGAKKNQVHWYGNVIPYQYIRTKILYWILLQESKLIDIDLSKNLDFVAYIEPCHCKW